MVKVLRQSLPARSRPTVDPSLLPSTLRRRRLDPRLGVNRYLSLSSKSSLSRLLNKTTGIFPPGGVWLNASLSPTFPLLQALLTVLSTLDRPKIKTLLSFLRSHVPQCFTRCGQTLAVFWLAAVSSVLSYRSNGTVASCGCSQDSFVQPPAAIFERTQIT
ncbi:hypothetical protein C8R47DRAFT_252366 [Mycena vitilis]|nr:hypothetical protein C8R47DRAFT_252366 [Mycena vitilis]